MPQSLMPKKLKLTLWSPTTPSRTKTKKRCHFHHRGLECNSRKLRDTRNNRQIWPWSTKCSRAKANRVLSREHIGCSKNSFLATQEIPLEMTSPSPNSIEIRLIMFFVPEDEKVLYSQLKQDMELTVAQLISSLLQNSGLNWRKWGKLLGHSA